MRGSKSFKKKALLHFSGHLPSHPEPSSPKLRVVRLQHPLVFVWKRQELGRCAAPLHGSESGQALFERNAVILDAVYHQHRPTPGGDAGLRVETLVAGRIIRVSRGRSSIRKTRVTRRRKPSSGCRTPRRQSPSGSATVPTHSPTLRDHARAGPPPQTAPCQTRRHPSGPCTHPGLTRPHPSRSLC